MGGLDPLLSAVGGKYNQAEETIQRNSIKIENLTEHSVDLGGEHDFVSPVKQKHNVTVGEETVDAEEVYNENEPEEKDTFENQDEQKEEEDAFDSTQYSVGEDYYLYDDH